MNSKIIKVLLTTALSALLGLLASEFVPPDIWPGLEGQFLGTRWLSLLGIIVGALEGFPFGMYWISKKRRWLLIALLNMEFVLSTIVGGRLGLFLTTTASALTFCISAFSIRALFADDEWAALRYHLKLVLGIVQGFQIVDEGKTVYPLGSNQLLGPRLLIIRPWNAVVMQSGARQTRISGPAVLTTAPFEYVSHTYDLREKPKSVSVADVLTRDAVSVTLHVTVSYSLNVHCNARRGDRPFLPAETEAIARMMANTPEWEMAAKAAVEQSARYAVASYTLDELLDSTRLPRLADRIRGLANSRTQQWGIAIHHLVIENLQPQAEVKQTTTGRWMAREQAETVITTETARAAAVRDAFRLLADGYEYARQHGMSTVEVGIEVLRRIFENQQGVTHKGGTARE